MRPRALIGPVVLASWVIAAGWFAIATLLLVASRSSLAVALGGVALVLGAGTAWVGAGMVVRLDDRGVSVGRQQVPWAEIDGVCVRRGGPVVPLQVPVLARRRGRALVDVELDGLASVGGAGPVVRAVRPIAERAGVEVELVGQHGRRSPGRRVQG